LNAISPGSAKLYTSLDLQPQDTHNIGCTADFFLGHMDNDLPKQVSSRIRSLLTPVPQAVVDRAASVIQAIDGRACLLWIRAGGYRSERNLTKRSYEQLVDVLEREGISPILVGDSATFVEKTEENLIEFYKNSDFFENNPLHQLQLLDFLCGQLGIEFSIGMKSGAMDGLAFARRLRTLYAARTRGNERMDKASTAFPAFSLVPLHYGCKFKKFSKSELDDIRKRVS